MIQDFTETKSTATIFIYKSTTGGVEITPALESPRRLRISKNTSIELYRDVDDIRIVESTSRVEIHMRKNESAMWGGVNGKDGTRCNNGESSKNELSSDEDGSVMDLLSRIYRKSGDDVRRAMEKSFYVSGGTVLSTDWNQMKSQETKDDEGNVE